MHSNRHHEPFGPPYTQDELDDAQDRFGLRFPPDLVAFFRTHRPARWYDWTKDFEDIRSMLAWPYEGLLFSVQNSTPGRPLWWPEWGRRPDNKDERAARLRAIIDAAPKLIPLRGHRYIPETPAEAGNPVFSVHQADVIYVGVDLEDWVRVDQSTEPTPDNIACRPKWIDFWSEVELRACRSTREEAGAISQGL
jgi:hypothetical protein